MRESTGWRITIGYGGPNISEYYEDYNIYLPKSKDLEYFNLKRFYDEFANIKKKIHQLVEKHDIVLVDVMGIDSEEDDFSGWFRGGKVDIFGGGMESIELENYSREEFNKVIFELLEKVKEWAKEYCQYESKQIRPFTSCT